MPCSSISCDNYIFYVYLHGKISCLKHVHLNFHEMLLYSLIKLSSTVHRKHKLNNFKCILKLCNNAFITDDYQVNELLMSCQFSTKMLYLKNVFRQTPTCIYC